MWEVGNSLTQSWVGLQQRFGSSLVALFCSMIQGMRYYQNMSRKQLPSLPPILQQAPLHPQIHQGCSPFREEGGAQSGTGSPLLLCLATSSLPLSLFLSVSALCGLCWCCQGEGAK